MSERSKTLKRLRGMSDAELRKEEQEIRLSIWKMKIGRATGGSTEAEKLASAKRDLARVMTLARERETQSSRAAGR
jgi:ribosomal protein L29